MKLKHLIAATEWCPSGRYGRDRPRISVLLPTFCRGTSGLFLRAAQSVLGQSLAELELIIVDDASTDGTAEQIRRLMAKDDRVSCLRHPHNIGLPAVSEYEAFLKARAEVLAFAFDDDEFFPQALAELLAAMESGRQVMVSGLADVYFSDGATRPARRTLLGHTSHGQAMLRGTNYIPNHAVLLDRRVVQSVGFYDPHVAMSRVCDWDLWRRVGECFPIAAVPVPVGRARGPARADSLFHTRPLEPWLASEWMELPRNARLKPGAIEEYDVLAVPGELSAGAALAVREIGETFRDKFWFPAELVAVPSPKQDPKPCAPGSSIPRLKPDAQARVDQGLSLACASGFKSTRSGASGEGRLLLVNAAQDASATLYFDHLPPELRRRTRVVYPATHSPEEMVGAGAVIFVRHLLEIDAWLDWAAWLRVPHYYFLDDNFMLLGRLGGDYSYLRGYSNDAVRERLRGFAGVLLSSRPLLDYFRRHGLHANLLYFPPIARKPAWAAAPPAPPKPAGTTRIGFFGGSHRRAAFQREVFPAIAEIARERPVELFAAGMEEGALPAAAGLATVYLPHQPSYDIALARLAACQIDLLVHPNSDTPNNEYKTCNVLINAWAMDAVPLVSDGPPYGDLAAENVAVLCGADPRSWRDAIRAHAADPQFHRTLRQNLAAYCSRHYGGEANAAVLQAIFDAHPAPGAALCDTRWRRAVTCARQNAAATVGDQQRAPGFVSRRLGLALRALGHLRRHGLRQTLRAARRVLSEKAAGIDTW
jgi:glycosyltransferase involved in cell wall biosynthesis